MVISSKILSASSPAKAIDRLKLFYTTVINDQPKLGYSGCLVANTMSSMDCQNQDIQDVYSACFEQFIDKFELTVALAQQEGDLRPDLAPRQLIKLIHTTFFGILGTTKNKKSATEVNQLLTDLFDSLGLP